MKYPPFVDAMKSLLAHQASGTVEMRASESFIPVSRYTSQDFLRREITTLFRNIPLILGHEGQLPEPGFCMTQDALGLPILLARDNEGAIPARF